MRKSESGYTLVELLTVLAILSAILLVTMPNLRGGYESYLVRTNARGIASYLKLGRMRAVGENVTHVAEFNHAMAAKCPGRTASNTTDSLVVYRQTTPPATIPVDCFSMTRNVTVLSLKANPDKDRVSFRPNGMATNKAPNAFLVRSRNRRQCQMVCVNAAGIVRVNPMTTQCTASPYGASAATPCPVP